MSTKHPFDMPVKVEVFDPASKGATLRVGIPREALREMAVNGHGQVTITSTALADASGVYSLLIDVDRWPNDRPDAPTDLRETRSASGGPKVEGWLTGSADGQWYAHRDGNHARAREVFLERNRSAITNLIQAAQDEDALRALVEGLMASAFDAGAGR